MSEKRTERRGLGRGLSALMADVMGGADATVPGGDSGVQRIPIELLVPNADQPRRAFDDAALDELAASIADKGILQPLIVRPHDGGRYQIVAGERRWRAAQRAQLHDVPVIVREYSDQDVIEVAIIENIQRADLNPVEEAMAYRMLTDRFGHTQEKIAEALGKSRSHIANAMRLLSLPDPVLEMVRDGRLSAGHARALVTSPDPALHAALAVAQKMTVREVEKLAAGAGNRRRARRRSHAASEGSDADTQAIEADLGAALGMPVRLRSNAGGEGGTLTITWRSLDDLDLLCDVLSRARSAPAAPR
jgi:ParB family chromosome partitioning protein